jgi:hypothetical protein
VQQSHVLDVVEVYRRRNRGLRRHRGGGCDYRAQLAAVELHGVLTDLQDHRAAGKCGTVDDRLGVLEGDDVERTDAGACPMCSGDEVGGTGQGHLDDPSR